MLYEIYFAGVVSFLSILVGALYAGITQHDTIYKNLNRNLGLSNLWMNYSGNIENVSKKPTFNRPALWVVVGIIILLASFLSWIGVFVWFSSTMITIYTRQLHQSRLNFMSIEKREAFEILCSDKNLTLEQINALIEKSKTKK